jgi:hypothetical protein
MGAHRFTDLSGRRFGKLQVGNETFIRADSKGRTQRYWSCTCDCGVTKAIRASSLIRGRSKSCSTLRHRQQTLKWSGASTTETFWVLPRFCQAAGLTQLSSFSRYDLPIVTTEIYL